MFYASDLFKGPATKDPDHHLLCKHRSQDSNIYQKKSVLQLIWNKTNDMEEKEKMSLNHQDMKVLVKYDVLNSTLFEQERRVEKKANKVAFKEEKVRQEKQMLSLRTNIQGLKL